jgi:hypothetical protein
MTRIAALLILAFAVSNVNAVAAFSWTVSPDGAVEIAWDQVPFVPYGEHPAYVVAGERMLSDMLKVAAVADLEVVSAHCIASGISCSVTWQAQLKVPCGEYDLVAVLREEPYTFFEMYDQRIGCGGHQYFPIVWGGE